jgi:hypothetical protein
MIKAGAVIGGMTVAVICGAVTGIVGGALSISGVAVLLHAIVGS